MAATTHFAENITRLAGMFGLTQSQLAKALGVTPQTVSLWRSGREPSTPVMIRSSEIFELPAERLFSAEFADLMPLMADPDRYRRVEKNIQRELRDLKSV
jgi:transcriptional regulator with XRE-family HTH domain